MRNVFPSLDAFYAFESLLQPILQSSKGTCVTRPWHPVATSDADLGDIFSQHYPLLRSMEDAWTLQELAYATDTSGGKDKIYDSNIAKAEFVSVGTC